MLSFWVTPTRHHRITAMLLLKQSYIKYHTTNTTHTLIWWLSHTDDLTDTRDTIHYIYTYTQQAALLFVVHTPTNVL